MAYFLENDGISGKMGTAFAVIDKKTEELFYAKSVEATIEKNKVDVPILGRTNTPSRAAGWKGTGTLTVYYVTSRFRKLMYDYIKTGQDFWFDLQISNEQPGSAAGTQKVILKNCNLDSIIAAKFDATSDDMLDEEMPFTFSDYEIDTEFTAITGTKPQTTEGA